MPHTTDPVIAISAKAGWMLSAGQDIQMAAGETITLAAGQDMNWAVGGAARIHSGQAIGVLAGATGPGDQAAGKGITLIAGKGDIELQAQSDTLQVAAKGDVTVQSANAHIDWAAAKKIVLSVAGGANITLEGGNITVMCPGTMTVKAQVKSFIGPEKASYATPDLPNSGDFVRKYVVRRDTDQQPIPLQKYRMTLSDGRVLEGVTDAKGETSLVRSAGMQQAKIEILYD